MAKKKQIEQSLNDKLHHCQYNAPSMSCNAKQVKGYADRVLGGAEDILGCVEMLGGMGEGEAAEMGMYGETSE